MPNDDWDWEIADTAKADFDALEAHARDRIQSKLDSVVTDDWRDPDAYLEPLQGSPHSKLRVGQFRLGCRLDHDARRLYVLRIKKRGGNAYRGDDDD
jgi:mRNA interferase RelE/StbE